MQKLLFTLVLLVSLSGAATVARAQAVLPDSVAEKRMISSIGAAMCRELETENAKKPLANLSADESRKLFTRLIMTHAMANEELMGLFTSQPENAQKYGEAMGRKVTFWLVRECPVSQPLLMRVGMQEVAKKQPLTTQEQKFLAPIVSDVCRGLEAQQKKQDLKKLSAEQRNGLLQTTLKTVMKAHAKEIAAQYGTDIFLDEERMHAFGVKVGVQMANDCPGVLLLLSDQK